MTKQHWQICGHCQEAYKQAQKETFEEVLKWEEWKNIEKVLTKLGYSKKLRMFIEALKSKENIRKELS